MQQPSYLLWCTPPFLTFTKSFAYFDSFLLQVFEHLLGPRYFNSPKWPLAYKQTYFPIVFSDIGFILTTTIAPIAYLGNWALIVFIIYNRFIVDQHPFLLEALAWIDNNTFLFKQHLKVACNLLLPLACAYFFPFEQLIK